MINAVLVPSALTRPPPTAQMLVGETTARSLIVLFTAGVAATVQAVPFQCSINTLPDRDRPPIHTFVGLIAATAFNPPRAVPVGPVCTGVSAHAVPFQCIANTSRGTWFCAVAAAPTAHTSVADVPSTANSRSLRNCGSGTGTEVQVVPFQCRARPALPSVFAVSPTWPTAQASVAVRAN